MHQRDWKDLLLAVLVAYVITDLMLHLTMKKSAPSCAEKVMVYFSSEAGMLSLAIGILTGILVWYLSQRSKECYKKN